MAVNVTPVQREMVAACESGRIETLRRHATRSNVHFKFGEQGLSLPHEAAYYHRSECVEFLVVEMGIKANVIDDDGKTPLHYCASNRAFTSDCKKIIKLLLAHGASLKETDIHGHTVSHQASAFSDAEMVQFLVDLGANIHATTNEYCTPLHVAIHYGKAENACKLLLDNGADLSARNVYGNTPLHVAGSQHGKDTIIAHQLAMTRQLRQEVEVLRQEQQQYRQEQQDLRNFMFAVFSHTDRQSPDIESNTAATMMTTTTTSTTTTSDEE